MDAKEGPTRAQVEILLLGDPMYDSDDAREFRAVLRDIPQPEQGNPSNIIYNYSTVNIYHGDDQKPTETHKANKT